MCRFLETIKILDGVPQNLGLHRQRMRRTCNKFFPDRQPVNPAGIIHVPDDAGTGIYKCRITYGPQILRIDYEKYQPRRIKTLKLIRDDLVGYDFKFADRQHISRLFGQRSFCDDVLIVKNGFVADTSYCNILFSEGENWFTPDTPLLAGTCRQRLLSEGKILEKTIRPSDIFRYEKFMLVNAMLDFDPGRAEPVSGIKS